MSLEAKTQSKNLLASRTIVDEPWINELYSGIVTLEDIATARRHIVDLCIDVQHSARTVLTNDERRAFADRAHELGIHSDIIARYLREKESLVYARRETAQRNKDIDAYFFEENKRHHLVKMSTSFNSYNALVRRLERHLEFPAETVHVGGEEFLELKQSVVVSTTTVKRIGEETFERIRWYSKLLREGIDSGYMFYRRTRERRDEAVNDSWKVPFEERVEIQETLASIAARADVHCGRFVRELEIVGAALEKERAKGRLGPRSIRRGIVTEMQLLYDGGFDLTHRARDFIKDMQYERHRMEPRGWQP